MNRLEKFKIWAKLTWLDFRAYPKTALFSGLILIGVASLVFTWPSVALLKYALGFTASFTSVELSVLATQYVGGFSFWGHLAGISAFSGLSILYAVKFSVGTMNVAYLIIDIMELERLFEKGETDTQAFQDQLDSILENILGTPERLSLYMSTSLNANEEFYLSKVSKITSEDLKKLLEGCSSLEAADEVVSELAMEYSKIFWIEIIKASFKLLVKNESWVDVLVERAGELYPAPTCMKDRFEKVTRAEVEKRGLQYLGLKDLQEHFLDQGLSPYSVLGVSAFATIKEINSAYRQKCFTCHPDRAKTPEAVKQFLLLTKARDLLVNPTVRANVDRELVKNNLSTPSVPGNIGTVPEVVTMMRDRHGVDLTTASEGSGCTATPYRRSLLKI
ncbi:MAG: J domain-containing protein [Gammaproteobacteria bacterium]